MKKLSLFFISACICACQCTVPESSGNKPGTGDRNEEPASESIVLLFTNDLHSQIEPIDESETYNAGRGGVARIKVLVDSVRAAEKAVILADAGDWDILFHLYGRECGNDGAEGNGL